MKMNLPQSLVDILKTMIVNCRIDAFLIHLSLRKVISLGDHKSTLAVDQQLLRSSLRAVKTTLLL